MLHLGRSIVVFALAAPLLACTSSSSDYTDGGGGSGSGAGGASSDDSSGSSNQMTPDECADEYFANASAECGVGEAACGDAMYCTSDLDCISCVDRCTPFECGSDADCQERLGHLCPGVSFACEQYIDTYSCVVDYDPSPESSAEAGAGPSAVAVGATSSTGSGGCPEYVCADGVTCIQASWICDGEADCPGGEDESEAECGACEVTCADGACIPYAYVCDGGADCSGGEDEDDFVCSGSICDSGVQLPDYDTNVCLSIYCCTEFETCTETGNDVEGCIACLDAGSGARCDAALDCASAACGV